MRWSRYGLGVNKEAAIELEVRNVDSYSASSGIQKYTMRDILDTVNNVAGGVDLIGHQG